MDSGFKQKVYTLVEQIPKGRVMTYGQIASISGNSQASRIVGGIAHWGDPKLPWHRVVKKNGDLAEGYPGGVISHEQVLVAEGVKFINHKVDIKKLLWQPKV